MAKNDFTTKNANRRAARAEAGRQYSSARKSRKARSGAFGSADKEIYNELVVGTTGKPKK